MNVKKWGILLLTALLYCPEGFASEAKTRLFLTTGEWYQRDARELEKTVAALLCDAKVREAPGAIRAIIAPHAGIQFSGACAAAAYKLLEKSPRRSSIRRVIILGSAHRAAIKGAAVPSFDYDSTPLGPIPIDTAVTSALAREKGFSISDNALQYEHSIENQLPFLQLALKNIPFKVVPVLFGHLNSDDFAPFARILEKYTDENTLLVVSTDLTHYGYSFGYVPFEKDIRDNLTRLDKGMIETMEKLDFSACLQYKSKTDVTMCGFVPTAVLLKMMSPKKHTALLTDYYKSGDRNGDYNVSVSYASLVVTDKLPAPEKEKKMKQPETDLTQEEQKILLTLARETLESHLGQGCRPEPEALARRFNLTPAMQKNSGVFVTLRKKGALRGCIGSLTGTAPLFLAVRDNAINAAVSDFRFPTVTLAELKDIDIEISAMTPLQPISDYKTIRLKTDGVIIRKGGRQAVYLPQVAEETGWSLDEFLGNLCLKAGLPYNSFKEAKDMEFLIFQASVFSEK